LFGLRVNTECDCSGQADVTIGALRYQENNLGQAVTLALEQTANEKSVATPFEGIHIVAGAGEPVMRGSKSFIVTGGKPYKVTAQMRTAYGSAQSGYVAIFFLDDKNKEVSRARLAFETGGRSIGTAVTDSKGHFSFPANYDNLLHSN